MCDTVGIAFYYVVHMHPQKISGTSVNFFYEMNGDVGMEGWKLSMNNSRNKNNSMQLLARKSYIHPYILLLLNVHHPLLYKVLAYFVIFTKAIYIIIYSIIILQK